MTSPSLNIQMCKRTTTSLSVDGHLGCFHVLIIVNSAALKIGVHISFRIRVFSEYIPRIRIAGSYGFSLFSFFKELPYCFP